MAERAMRVEDAAARVDAPPSLQRLMRSARGPATESEKVPLGLRRRQGGRSLVGDRGLALPAQPSKQIGSRRVERVVVVQVQLVHQSQRSSGGPAPRRWRWRGSGPRPAWGRPRAAGRTGRRSATSRSPYRRGVRMHGVDGRLELIGTGLVAAKAPADDRLALLDQGPIPSCAVLLTEQHEGAVGPRSRRAARLGEEQQRKQAVPLRDAVATLVR